MIFNASLQVLFLQWQSKFCCLLAEYQTIASDSYEVSTLLFAFWDYALMLLWVLKFDPLWENMLSYNNSIILKGKYAEMGIQ